MSALVNRLYNSQSIQQWQHKRTMLHSSGIWGREPVLEYLADQVIKSGDVVVDVGAGAGFPTLRMAEMAGPAGNVVGIELSEAMIEAARHHCRAANLSFQRADISQELPLPEEFADIVTGLIEVERILMTSGRAVFLTMHPDAFESRWDLQFLAYDLSALQRYRDAADKEDLEIPGSARNVNGGENAIMTIYHSRRSIADAASDAGLALIDERDLWIDRETAAQTFGASSIRCMPTTPIYWMLTLAKSTAVANGHEDAAPINGFMFEQRTTVTS